MKTPLALALAIVSSVSHSAHADPSMIPFDSSAIPPPAASTAARLPLAPTEERESERDGRRMRNAGVVLTALGIAGSALVAAGLGLSYGHGPAGESVCPDCRSIAATSLAISGGILAAVGLSVGIPLWTVGQHRIDRSRSETLARSPTGDGAGASLSYALRF